MRMVGMDRLHCVPWRCSFGATGVDAAIAGRRRLFDRLGESRNVVLVDARFRGHDGLVGFSNRALRFMALCSLRAFQFLANHFPDR